MNNLEKVENLINVFLKEHGGMNNGFETFVSGVVDLGHKEETKVYWSTPKKENLTLKESLKI